MNLVLARDLKQCASLFDEHIRPVETIYERAFGFMPTISLWVIIFWIFFIFGFLYLLNLSIIFYWIAGLHVVNLLFLHKKEENRKKSLRFRMVAHAYRMDRI